MLIRGFWDKLEYPVIALSPMDGVTDAAFRHMICKYSSPAFVMTEFTNVEGLARGVESMLRAFIYSENERPVVGQIYGVEVDSFYKCSLMLCALGFDGIDINMGCPANNVAKRGSGAGLIQTPELARKIIRSCKKAALDWSEGVTLEEAGVAESVVTRIAEMNVGREVGRGLLPVSVKTRIGYDSIVVEEWLKHLLEELPANISLHGRTLKQMYLGEADWEAISRAVEVCRGSGVTLLGNGDVKSMEDARAKISEYGVDGVLVGRAVMGEPWFFGGVEPATLEERVEILLEHSRYFDELGVGAFYNVKKHLAWYSKGFKGAKETRMELMRSNTLEDVERICKKIIEQHNEQS